MQHRPPTYLENQKRLRIHKTYTFETDDSKSKQQKRVPSLLNLGEFSIRSSGHSQCLFMQQKRLRYIYNRWRLLALPYNKSHIRV